MVVCFFGEEIGGWRIMRHFRLGEECIEMDGGDELLVK